MLKLDGYEAVGGDQPGTFKMTDLGAVLLAMDESTTVEVTFTCLGEHEQVGRAVIRSSDTDNPEEFVRLRGGCPVVLPQRLVHEPSRLDMGTAGIGCEATGTLQLWNAGDRDLVIDAISPNSTLLALQVPTLPATLTAADAPLTVGVTLTVPRAGPLHTGLTLVSSDPDGPRTVTVQGRGDDTLPPCE